MKLVPLAHEAFLGLIGCKRLAELPAPRYDLQTGQLTASEDAEEVQEFVSVLLRPHKEVTGIGKVEASDRRAVYDGVIQYGATLLVCIESKLLATASGQQARKINAKKLQWKNDRLIHVRWEQLLDRWLNLLALGVLGAAETQVLDDFFDVAERYFGDLLPFNTLERCGTNMRRRLRRLRVLLEDATGLEVPLRRDGVTAKFAPGTTVTTQQATLWVDDEAVHLGIWPAELAAQYNALFGDPARREGLLDLAGRPGWTCTPNMHVAYRFATGPQRWYPRKQKQLPLATYFDQWTASSSLTITRITWSAPADAVTEASWSTLSIGFSDRSARSTAPRRFCSRQTTINDSAGHIDRTTSDTRLVDVSTEKAFVEQVVSICRAVSMDCS